MTVQSQHRRVPSVRVEEWRRAGGGLSDGGTEESEVKGYADPRFVQVRDIFAASLAQNDDLGASVAVWHRGEPVVDLWGGYATEDRDEPWDFDSIANTWSITKTMTNLCALLLLDRGEIDLHSPVARYWPEFAKHGKDSILVRHILGHTSGMAGFSERFSAERLADWEFCVDLLAEQAPWWEPGTASGYHALTQGYLVGEIVRRTTGISIGAFFEAEVAGPLAADFFIGLPETEEHRVVPLTPPPPADLGDVKPRALARRALVSPVVRANVTQQRWWRAAEIPAANGHGNARSVALVQSTVSGRGEVAGKRLLSGSTIDLIFDTQAEGDDLIFGVPMRFGTGWGLSSSTYPLGPRACYWGGYGGSLVVSDLDAEITVAYVMNKMGTAIVGDPRGVKLAAAALNAAYVR
jgi:CubicO group peptidase (beta-lactamase class C family)